MSTDSIEHLPDTIVPNNLRKQALDVDFHWVNETGGQAKLTSGVTMQATVRLPSAFDPLKIFLS